MNYLSVENLRKAYNERVLLDNITFGIEKGQKTALIAPNGSGKTTLMRILAGADTPDSGTFSFRREVRVGMLAQDPDFGTARTIGEAIFVADTPLLKAVRNYELALENTQNEAALQQALTDMDNLKAWDMEQRIKTILTRFRVGELGRSLSTLSGGQRKRVALARLLVEDPDFLILDEPTNHLDVDMIEWLEEQLSQQQVTLLMVTHDRYFMENVCDDILELDRGKVYRYKGNYAYFLEKKAEREQAEAQSVQAARNLMRKELDWIRRQPKARGTKAKYRVEAFQDLKKQAEQNLKKDELKLSLQMARLGKKVLEMYKVNKAFGEQVLLHDFSYIFRPGEKVGIIGRNGVGKSTFLNLITQELQPDSGTIVLGDTVSVGYYRQDGISLPQDKRVIEVVTDIAEQITVGNHQTLSPLQLLERFLFPPKQQYAYVSTLSGGERRRLYLLTILARNPNFLILDEPTNDLDILTLQVLEDFLADFAGCVMVVTHDRYFMDRIVEHLFVFEGEGAVRDFHGTYSEFRAVKEWEEEQARITQQNVAKAKKNTAAGLNAPSEATKKAKRSFKEQKEFEALEIEIEKLEAQKATLTAALSTGTLSNQEILSISLELEQVIAALELKSERWLDLAAIEE